MARAKRGGGGGVFAEFLAVQIFGHKSTTFFAILANINKLLPHEDPPNNLYKPSLLCNLQFASGHHRVNLGML